MLIIRFSSFIFSLIHLAVLSTFNIAWIVLPMFTSRMNMMMTSLFRVGKFRHFLTTIINIGIVLKYDLLSGLWTYKRRPLILKFTKILIWLNILSIIGFIVIVVFGYSTIFRVLITNLVGWKTRWLLSFMSQSSLCLLLSWIRHW